jgi:caffeoyl-CoA O-methyltransferase
MAQVAETTRSSTSAPQMMVGPMEGRFLNFLVTAVGARRVLEIGTFTGYSALWMAAALPEDGRLITCEADVHHAELARRHFEASPYGDRIELRHGRALDTLRILEGPFDFVFVDADKTSYEAYFEAVLPMLAPHGLLAVDNVLWRGTVLAPADDDGRALAAFNEKVAGDARVECVMLTVRDGITLVRHRAEDATP